MFLVDDFGGAPTVLAQGQSEAKVTREEITNVTTLSFHGSTPLEHVYDNSIDTYVDSDYNNPVGKNPQWFLFELGSAEKITKVRIHPRTSSVNGRPNAYKIYLGETLEALNEVSSGNIDPSKVEWFDINLNPTQAKYVKVELHSSNFDSVKVCTVAEIELYKDTTPTPVDTSVLSTTLDSAKAIKNGENYNKIIPSVKAEIEAAMAEAQAIIDNPTQYKEADVNRVNDRLNKAIADSGKYQGDLTELCALVKEVEAMDLSVYSEDSKIALLAALNTARNVIALGENADVQSINDSFTALQTAKNNLKADNYTSLVALRDKYSQVMNEDYTRASWKEFKNALYNVEIKLEDENKNITDEQYNTLSNALIEKHKNLTKGTPGTEYGKAEYWNDKNIWRDYKFRGGQLFVSNEVQNVDGTSTLTVTWINDGLDQETGGLMFNSNMFNKPAWSKREIDSYEWNFVKALKAEVLKLDGTYESIYVDQNNVVEDVWSGEGFPDGLTTFNKEITVPAGSKVFLSFETGIDGDADDINVASIGYYHVKDALDTTGPEITNIERVYDEKNNVVNYKLTVNEDIVVPEGWTSVDGRTYTFTLNSNGEYTFNVYDLSGNYTTLNTSVTEIKDPTPETTPTPPAKPEVTPTPTPSEKPTPTVKPEVKPEVKPVAPQVEVQKVPAYDDGGPFTTDKCGSVYDRWGNLMWKAPACNAQTNDGYNLVNTSDR